jgi:hypothetical protein
MQKMTLEDTQKLVDSYVKTYGQSGAAQKLNEQGYRSPMCATILQAHICRIMNGSSTCLLAPETEDQQQEPPITKEPIAAAPKRRREIEKILASEELLQKEIAKTAAEIEQELIAEQAAIEEMERSLPPLVPLIESRPHREARHMEKAARVNAIFDRRSEVKLDEDRYFFGIPCLRHKPVTNSRPYQQRRYGQNVLSTRDLSVHQK